LANHGVHQARMTVADVVDVVAMEIHEAMAGDVLKPDPLGPADRGKTRRRPGLAEEHALVALQKRAVAVAAARTDDGVVHGVPAPRCLRHVRPPARRCAPRPGRAARTATWRPLPRRRWPGWPRSWRRRCRSRRSARCRRSRTRRAGCPG